jgi:hypothetical protein
MKLFLECKPDEMLAITLGVPKSIIIHSNDKGGVCKRLSKSRGMKGMIDEDPTSAQPAYLKGLKQQDAQHGIRYLIDYQCSHRVVVLCPRLEEWILRVCRNRNGRLDITRFGLPDNANRLHEQINFQLRNFEKTINELVKLQNPAILYLQKLLLS